MYREVKYDIKIEPLPHKNMRNNINAYYIILKSEKDGSRIFSKPLLIDSESNDQIFSTNDLNFDRVELWNYEKMKMIESQKTAFALSQSFSFTSKIEQICYSVTRVQVAKTNKNIDIAKLSKPPISTPASSNRKNSEGQYKEIFNNLKKDSGSNKTESQQDSFYDTRGKNTTGNKIVSVKEYHAY